MDCDQVFMILTRGPFPTGALTDEQVEDHLEACAECWRLAEALRPADEVFQEAVPAIESRDLPGYWGDARPARAAVAQLANSTARVSAARARPTAVPVHYRQRRDVSAARWVSETLPAMAMASAFTAAILGLVFWLRS